MRRFSITEDEHARLMQLSARALSAPVMMVGGVDISESARQQVYAEWRTVGQRHGFDGMTVQPHPSGDPLMVLAEPLQ